MGFVAVVALPRLILALLLACLSMVLEAKAQTGVAGNLIVPTPFAKGDKLLPSTQAIHPAGAELQFIGRPVDLVLSLDGQRAFVKTDKALLVINTVTWKIQQQTKFPAHGASMHGIALGGQGSQLYVTGSLDELYEYSISPAGTCELARTIKLAVTSVPCGVAISKAGNKAFVCLSRSNSLAVVNLASGTIERHIPVGVAPWDVVLAPDEKTAYVSDWGGRHPRPGDLTAPSSGTQVVVDDRGVGASGVVSIVDLAGGMELTELETGLHPSDLELSRDGATLYVANANSDTVSVINTGTRQVIETIRLRPDPDLQFGSAPDALALSRDGRHLFVAVAGNNAVAVVELPDARQKQSRVSGYLPTAWYPGALVVDSDFIYVANVKGVGTVPSNLLNSQGTIDKIPLSSLKELKKHTETVRSLGRIQEALQANATPRRNMPPKPVPERAGEPSVFAHVLYIIKENRAYDSVLGDLPQGNGDPKLCLFPREVTPNHHALATEYVLLDNYYCNGVLSSDGHSWCVEANVTDHVEKSFGGFNRSYAVGTDALTYSSSGFIWNNALRHGLTFRNYGELNMSWSIPGSTWLQIYRDFTNHTDRIHFRHDFGVAAMMPYNSTNVPGWNMSIPDVVRAAGFLKEFHEAEAKASWPTFNILYLPEDHTMGAEPGFPTPRAQLADNDLALGQVVEAVTRSRFGSNTCIFVMEDDPQAGPDHVDGRRSFCFVVSPYTRRHQTLSKFYNQAGVIHTMEQILGLPPLTQWDAMSPLLRECFTESPDFTPYKSLTNNLSLAEMNPGTTAYQNREERLWAERSLKLDFSHPDLANEDVLNRIIWHSVKGNARYPSEFSGAHGKGLKVLGLIGLKPQRDTDD